MQGKGSLEWESEGGPLELLGWQSGSLAGPPLRLVHPGFAVLEYLAAHGIPTVPFHVSLVLLGPLAMRC